MDERIIEATRVFYENRDALETVLCNIGGSRSSKSFSIAQIMLHDYFHEERDKVLLTCRKTVPSLKLTIYHDVIKMMKDLGWYDYFIHNKTERTIYYPAHNNLWIFTSVDDEKKIRSTEFNYIHMEEANEFTYDDYMMLKLRMSGKEGPGEKNRMFMSLNPSEKYGWVNTKLIGQEDVKLIHSTYMDCIKFLPRTYVERLERLKKEDPTYWKVFGLGEFTDIKGKIHSLTMWKGEYPKCKETIFGLDFGFVNPNALVKIGVDLEQMKLFLTLLLYKTGQTNEMLIEDLKEFKKNKEIRPNDEIYCDSAEPARIEEIHKNGFNAKPADKSVLDGIDFVNRFELISTEDQTDQNREMLGYKRKEDKDGNILEDPLKFQDHVPNAVRYGAYTHLRSRFLHEEAADVYHAGMKERMRKPKQKRVEERDDHGEIFHGGDDGFD